MSRTLRFSTQVKSSKSSKEEEGEQDEEEEEIGRRRRRKMFQICLGDYCLYTFEDSWISGTNKVTCPVCRESIRMFVMLDACSHLFCLECVNTWRMHNKSSTCPLCRGVYGNAIASDSPFKTLEKAELFRKHANCSRRPSERLLTLWQSTSRHRIEDRLRDQTLCESNYRALLKIVDDNLRLKILR